MFHALQRGGCYGYVTDCRKFSGCFKACVKFLQPPKAADPLMKRYGAGNTAEMRFAGDSTKPVETFVERVLRVFKTGTKNRYLYELPKKRAGVFDTALFVKHQ